MLQEWQYLSDCLGRIIHVKRHTEGGYGMRNERPQPAWFDPPGTNINPIIDVTCPVCGSRYTVNINRTNTTGHVAHGLCPSCYIARMLRYRREMILAAVGILVGIFLLRWYLYSVVGDMVAWLIVLVVTVPTTTIWWVVLVRNYRQLGTD